MLALVLPSPPTDLDGSGRGGEGNQGTGRLVADSRTRRLEQVVDAPDKP